MNTKQLYKYYVDLIQQNVRNEKLSKCIYARYKQLSALEQTSIEKKRLRNCYFEISNEINNSFNRQKNAVLSIVKQMQPTHLQTITFNFHCKDFYEIRKSISTEEFCHKTIKLYLKKVNKKLFNRRKDARLEVLTFIETNKSDEIHYHLLLKNPQYLINNKEINFKAICKHELSTLDCIDLSNLKNAESFKELSYQDKSAKFLSNYLMKECRKINDLPIQTDLMYIAN